MPPIDVAEANRWVASVQAVVDQAHSWAQANGWQASEKAVTLTEDGIGTYVVPVLTVDTPMGKVVVEPIARWSSPGEGRIDVYGWPSLNRLMLIRRKGGWSLLTEAGMEWRQPWNQQTFLDLASNLNAAA